MSTKKKTSPKQPSLKDVAGYRPTHPFFRELLRHKIQANVQTFVIGLTPKLAREALENNTLNRSMYRPHVESLKRDIVNGNWKFTGQPLLFDDEGNLRNGQQTCTACAETNVTIPVMVVWGVAADAFPAMDGGRKRTLQQWLAYNGYKNPGLLAGMVNYLARYQLTGWPSLGGTRSTPISSVHGLGVVEANPDLVKFAVSDPLGPYIKGYSRCLLCIFHYLLFRMTGANYQDRVKEFFEQLRGDTKSGDPAFAYRSRIQNDSRRKRKRTPVEDYAILVKCWNAHVNGRLLNVVTWGSSESTSMPMIQVDNE